MSTLLLRLAGPMQAWGSGSRFVRRATDHAPTKSGVIGLLAAARGLRRTDPLEDLLALQFGVRLDQPGRIERDFQTTRTVDGGRSFPLTERYYLTDATFVAAVEGDDGLIAALDAAVRRPVYPLYLGRRSCPPVGALTLGTRTVDVWTALTTEPWQAAPWWRKRQDGQVHLELRLDADAVPEAERGAGVTTDKVHDAPLSFDPQLRSYGWRAVTRTSVVVENPDARPTRPGHDPMSLLGGA